MSGVYNFSAGPSVLPEPVLAQAAAELTDYRGTGQSVMEMSHRSAAFRGILDEAEERLRRLMGIPDHYRVLFLQGGASTQFAMVPLNLMNGSGKADYVLTGQWAVKAFREAAKYGDVRAAASSEAQQFRCIPAVGPACFRRDADYVHICLNNTIYGTQYTALPDTGGVPLAADASSCILSRPMDVAEFGLLYAGAQKNLAPAGLTVVIVRADLLGRVRADCPTMLDYRVHAEHGSLYNTPPCWSIYMALLVLRWLEEDIGGLAEMARRNEAKAALLYDFLDRSALFRGTAAAADRSRMNVPFVTGDAGLDALFLREAEAAGLVNLKGHRSVGGMRASLYNAMPRAGVEALVAFMGDFEARHG